MHSLHIFSVETHDLLLIIGYLKFPYLRCKPWKKENVFLIQFLPSGVPTEQTNSSSRRREFRRGKPTSVLVVGSSDGANQLQFSSSGVPTGQTNFSYHRREFRRGKPTLVLVVGSSDGVGLKPVSSLITKCKRLKRVLFLK